DPLAVRGKGERGGHLLVALQAAPLGAGGQVPEAEQRVEVGRRCEPAAGRQGHTEDGAAGGGEDAHVLAGPQVPKAERLIAAAAEHLVLFGQRGQASHTGAVARVAEHLAAGLGGPYWAGLVV